MAEGERTTNTDRSVLTARDYQDALTVQDACNLSGVVRSFATLVGKVWDDARAQGKGTDFVNTHPICQLFADKIADLARVRDFDTFSRAHQECKRRAQDGAA